MIARIAMVLGLGISGLAAQWPPVPAWDFSTTSAAAFADHELDVPYHLRHFAQVANAVVENPFTDSTGTHLSGAFHAALIYLEYSVKTPASRPWSEWVGQSRVFSLTDAEFVAATAARRAQLQSQFGNWGPLAVPSSSSYIPAFVHDAVTPLNVWHPTAAQRTADPALIYQVEASATLAADSWAPVWTSTGPGNIPGPVTVPGPTTDPAQPSGFLRLRVIRSEGS